MAYVQILSWQDLPSQIKIRDDFDEIKIELPHKFIARIDAAAQKHGLTSGEEYLSQWKWSNEEEREGSVEEVAAMIQSELEAQFP